MRIVLEIVIDLAKMYKTQLLYLPVIKTLFHLVFKLSYKWKMKVCNFNNFTFKANLMQFGVLKIFLERQVRRQVVAPWLSSNVRRDGAGATFSNC